MDGVGAGGGKTAAGWRVYRQSVRRPGGVGTLPAVTIPCTHRGNASGARAGIGTGASHARDGEAEGPVVGGLPAPFFCPEPARRDDAHKNRQPGRGRAAVGASTSDRAGTGGIQISLPDIDMDWASRVKT